MQLRVRSRWRLVILASLVCWASSGAAHAQQPTKEQQAKLRQLQATLQQAGLQYQKRKLKAAAELVKQAQTELEGLTAKADPALLKAVAPLYARLQRAHQLLKARGIKNLPQLKPLVTPPKAPTPPPNPDGPVAFTTHVAPILVTKCGRCHINNARGMVSMSNFETLMKGPDAGAIILAGNAEGSRVIEVIEEGDMPRGGLKVTPAELGALKKWIAEGAKFDGKDAKANLTDLAPSAKPADLARVEPKRAGGKETIHFSIDIAPIFAKHCSGCHGAGDRPQGRFDMMTFRRMLRGGDSGPGILPGKAADSLLIKKLEGTGGGDRMPRNQPPLDPEIIAKIKTWISEGATLDDGNFDTNLRQLAAMARSKRLTAEQVSKERIAIAESNWRLSLPEVKYETHTADHFLVLGTLAKSQLAQIAREAESIYGRIRPLVRAKKTDDVLKGRITIFVLTHRYDYSEFGMMVQKREVPPRERSTGRYNVVDAYVAIYVPQSADEESGGKLGAVLAEPLAKLAVSAAGESPQWYRTGLARAITAKLMKSDEKVKAWLGRSAQVAASMKDAKTVLAGSLPDDDGNIAAMIVGSYLLKDTRRFKRLQRALTEGKPFDPSFAAIYGAPPEAWLNSMLGNTKKKK